MIKRIFSSILCAIVTISAMAQNETLDSIKVQELDEVVIVAQMQNTSPNTTTYIPSGKQKNAAQNAIGLLQQMAIPQIRINPIDKSVVDNSGEDVSIFVNYMPASKEDIDGLRTADVRKVEYVEFSTDPRFRGALHVINFIVQEYEYGGYTKITADEDLLVGLSSIADIYSKFAYKKMTYDLYVAANNLNNHHSGYDVNGQYTLKNADRTDYILKRSESIDMSHLRQNQYPVTFRASYNTEKLQIRNTLGYSHSSNPINKQSGSLTYLPEIGDDYITFSRYNPSHSNSLSYQGTFFFALPKDFSINVSPQFSYSHNNNLLIYTTTSSEPILRKARENAYNYRVQTYLNKRFAQKHTLMLGIHGSNTINRLKYTGNAVYDDRFNNAYFSGSICHQFKTQKISLYTDVGLLWEQSDINGLKNSDRYPFVHLNLSYTPNSKNAFSTYFQFANNSPGIDQKASDLLRDNEFMYISGNPLLNNSRHLTVNLSYTWLPSNMLNMNAYGRFFELFDRFITAYEPYDSGRALLRTYINDGNYIQSEIGIAVTLNLFDKSLQIYVSPNQRFYRSTGMFNKRYNPFQVTAQTTYYLKKWYFMAYYQSPQKMMFTATPTIYKSRDYYAFVVGWTYSSWNIRLSAYNLFNSHWDTADRFIQTPLYSEHRTNYGTNSHARLNFAVTYTFGYGRKVQRGNEVGEQSGASSAILK